MNCPDCDKEIEEMVVLQDAEHFKDGDIVGACHNCKRIFRKCEVWSRVVGYLRPTNDWNKGKQAEFPLRKTYDIKC